MIDQNAVARVLGVTTTYKDLKGGATRVLPQRVALIAQGQTGSVFPNTKWEVTSLGDAGLKYGFRSAIYLALRELIPANGDGVGTIPITVYPQAEPGSAVAATGSITPSGTLTRAAALRLRVGGVLGDAFVLNAGAITGSSLSDACRKIRASLESVLHMPVNTANAYGTVTAGALSGTGNGTLTALSVLGVPKPGVHTLKCVATAANGGTWSHTDPDGVVITSSNVMTTGVGTPTVFNTAGVQYTITDGTTDFGLGATFTIHVPATAVNLTVAWKGKTGNDVKVELVEDGSNGEVAFALSQPSGGLLNPSPADALTQIGNTWETMVLNGSTVDDTAIHDEFQVFGEGRWGTLTKKPLVVFTGQPLSDLDAATAVVRNRPTDRVMSQLTAPGCPNLPIVIAARQLARIVKVANDNPACNYTAEQATGLTPGADGVQWDYSKRQIAVTRGSSTIEVVDGVVNISDIMTAYRPTGEIPPAYRYVCDIVKLQNIIFNVNLIFAAKEWAGAPLLPDAQVTRNRKAKKPKMAKAALAALVDNLALDALISDPESAKASIFAYIDKDNPKRLNVGLTIKLSGNTQIIDVALDWGFYFGGAPALAA